MQRREVRFLIFRSKHSLFYCKLCSFEAFSNFFLGAARCAFALKVYVYSHSILFWKDVYLSFSQNSFNLHQVAIFVQTNKSQPLIQIYIAERRVWKH